MNTAAFSRGFPDVWHPEWLKWVGLGCMLVDHIGAYVFAPNVLTEAFGALAFPFFAFALAVGLRNADPATHDRCFQRCMMAGIIAEAARLLVETQVLPLNVLFTLGLGVAFARCIRTNFPLVQTGLVLLGAFVVEFSVPGVLLVAFGLRYAQTWQAGYLWAGAACLFALLPFNEQAPHVALLAVPLAALLALLPRDLPRVPRFFYLAYIVQWPLLWVAASLFAA